MNNSGQRATDSGQALSRRTRTLAAAFGGAGGFTLVELLVVLAIVATLLTLAVPRYFQHVDRSKEAVLRENLATMRDAIDQYHADVGQWPGSLESLVERRYLRALPMDPITESQQTWQAVLPDDGVEGIRDVRSGADGTSLDGSLYADW